VSDAARELAPTGTLRVAVWTVSYFAVPDPATGRLEGVIPDLAAALARRLGVPAEPLAFDNPARIIAAFRNGAVDVTFLGVTADRAEAIEFGPRVFELQTTWLVPANSPIHSIDESTGQACASWCRSAARKVSTWRRRCATPP
jgi:polar amino acid transport system substrate-binding protein